MGDTGSRRLKQTFFTNAAERPSIGGAATQPCVRHLRCGRGSGEEAVTEKEGREEKRGTNYSSHELRLRERDPRRAAMAEEEDILSFFGEGERKTREE